MKSLTYVEIETPPWIDGSPPGAAVVWRFAKPTLYLPKNIEAIPSLASASINPAVISLGENLGQRATVNVSFRDHRHIFNGEPFDQGTFWAKWRGRYGTRLRGRPLRLIYGLLGQSLAEMETWHFFIESTNGPTPDGTYSIVAQDLLKFADDDRALAPRPTNGFLVSPIDDNDTAATLGPSGIGNAQYDAEGYINFGGKEVCEFTRSGDALTLTRNVVIPGFSYETEVVAHAAGTRAQQCLPFIGEDAADILETLFVDFAGMPSGYIPLAAWQAETGAYLQTVYTTLICEPTGVNKLASEVIAQAAMATWWDPRESLERLQVLRAVASTAAQIDENIILPGTLRTQDQPGKRLSEVLTYFGLRNPLKPIDQPDNYRSALLSPDLEAEQAYGGLVNRTIYSRWIAFGGSAIAQRLNLILLGRFRDPPRSIAFELYKHGPVETVIGGGYQVGWTENQDQAGNPVLAPIQVTQLGRDEGKLKVTAEEMLFTELQSDFLTERVVTIDADAYNINLRTLHDQSYPEITEGDLASPGAVRVVVIIGDTVTVGSTSTALPAIDVGDWVTGLDIELRHNAGRIAGKGGAGQFSGTSSPAAGLPGGPALYTRFPIRITGNGDIFGGAGAGGQGGPVIRNSPATLLGPGGPGGGGAGRDGGEGATPSGSFPATPGASAAGTDDDGGAGGTRPPGLGTGGVAGANGGDGGDPGLAGDTGPSSVAFNAHLATGWIARAGAAGGAPGAAIDGDSFVTIEDSPDIRGPQIN